MIEVVWCVFALLQPPADDMPLTAADRAVLERLEVTQERVAAVAGRAFRRPVEARILDRDQLREHLTAWFERELPAAQWDGWQAAARAFGLIPADLDLQQSLLDLLTSQVGGFYDPGTDHLYCISSGIGFLSHFVLTHETVHALQDQHHDLRAYTTAVRDHDDRAAARQAVIEGEAQDVAHRCLARYARAVAAEIPVTETQDLLAFGADQVIAGLSVSPYLAALLTFPYVHGEAFVKRVREQGGPAAVALLYESPPLSTEQVCHPEKFLDPARRDDPREVTLPDLSAMLGRRIVFENTLGELQTELFVQIAGDPVRALRAAWGWDGDRYRVYRADDRAEPVMLHWRAVFDGEVDAAEMIDALRKVLERRAATAPATVAMDEARTRVTATTAAGAVASVAVRHGDRVDWLADLPAGVDVEALVRTVAAE